MSDERRAMNFFLKTENLSTDNYYHDFQLSIFNFQLYQCRYFMRIAFQLLIIYAFRVEAVDTNLTGSVDNLIVGK